MTSTHFKDNFLMDGVYWTSASRHSCPTQLLNCFHDSIPYVTDEQTPYPLKGGSCVAIIIGTISEGTQPRVVNCDANLPFACQGLTAELSPKNKVGYTFRMKSKSSGAFETNR